MDLNRRRLVGIATALASVSAAFTAAAAPTADPQMDRAAADAFRKLVDSDQSARQLNERALQVLVFPKIVKVGFLLGGAYGEGVMLRGGQRMGYYNSASASYGLQAGAQWFGYVLFFINPGALKYLDESQGLEIGVGPSVVVVDSGVAKKMSSTTITQDVYAIIFGQRGAMAGLGIEGSKITKI